MMSTGSSRLKYTEGLLDRILAGANTTMSTLVSAGLMAQKTPVVIQRTLMINTVMCRLERKIYQKERSENNGRNRKLTVTYMYIHRTVCK